jgi:hypothetical protein
VLGTRRTMVVVVVGGGHRNRISNLSRSFIITVLLIAPFSVSEFRHEIDVT